MYKCIKKRFFSLFLHKLFSNTFGEVLQDLCGCMLGTSAFSFYLWKQCEVYQALGRCWATVLEGEQFF